MWKHEHCFGQEDDARDVSISYQRAWVRIPPLLHLQLLAHVRADDDSRGFVTCHPHRISTLSSSLLALAWLRAGCWGCLRREPEGRDLALSPSLANNTFVCFSLNTAADGKSNFLCSLVCVVLQLGQDLLPFCSLSFLGCRMGPVVHRVREINKISSRVSA